MYAPKGNNYQPLNPDVVVVEEAGQILEALMYNVVAVTPTHACLIQSGDHMQLRATWRSIENMANSYDWNQFEWLLLPNGLTEYIMLEIQHRMMPTIATYPSKAFYGGALCNAVLASAPPRNFPCASQPEPMICIKVDEAKEEKQRNSFWNPSENEEVVKVVKDLRAGGDVTPEDIAVISPYGEALIICEGSPFQ